MEPAKNFDSFVNNLGILCANYEMSELDSIQEFLDDSIDEDFVKAIKSEWICVMMKSLDWTCNIINKEGEYTTPFRILMGLNIRLCNYLNH